MLGVAGGSRNDDAKAHTMKTGQSFRTAPCVLAATTLIRDGGASRSDPC